MEKLLYFPLAVDIITRNGYKKVLDLGCGEATFLRYLCESTSVIGFGVDLAPEAIEAGRERVQQAGLQDRIQLDVEDINQLEEIPAKWRDVDIVTTFFVLHEILYVGTEPVIRLLKSYRKLFKDIPLIVFEVIRPTPEEMRRRPGMGAHYFLQHDLTHQKPVSAQEWREIFRAAGFHSVEERYSSFARSAIFTLR
jgi:cyclopropane fatty-acyl-phospholipid synthase-like methyltransferase